MNLREKDEELDGKTRGAGGTTWFLFLNQLRPREDCSFPKDCWKVPASSLNLLVPYFFPNSVILTVHSGKSQVIFI